MTCTFIRQTTFSTSTTISSQSRRWLSYTGFTVQACFGIKLKVWMSSCWTKWYSPSLNVYLFVRMTSRVTFLHQNSCWSQLLRTWMVSECLLLLFCLVLFCYCCFCFLWLILLSNFTFGAMWLTVCSVVCVVFQEEIRVLRQRQKEAEMSAEQERHLRTKISDDGSNLVKENSVLNQQVVELTKQLERVSFWWNLCWKADSKQKTEFWVKCLLSAFLQKSTREIWK